MRLLMIPWHRDCAGQESNGNEPANVINAMKVQNRNLIADRYLLQGSLRQNGPVQLFDGLDEQLQRAVTVQILSAEGAQDRALSELFLRHQQIASDIHHCSIFAVYDAGSWEGRPFSVMERNTGSPALPIHHGSDKPPDVGHALAITRQSAEALQCCRDAGLSDWAFSPDVVRIDEQGNARLALLEGFQSTGGRNLAISSTPATDPTALGALLRIMLQGNLAPAASATATMQPLLPLPAPVMALLGRMSPGKEASLSRAGEVAQAISTLESALSQATQAYDAPPASAAEARGPQVISSGEAYAGSADAPTLAAVAVALPSLSPGVDLPNATYAPPVQATENLTVPTADRRKRLLLVALGVLLLASLLLVPLLPRLAGGATSPAPMRRLTPSVVAAPDLRGKSLDDARKAAGDAGLNLAQADSIYSAAYPTDTVASQSPDPGAQIQANSLITVSLSIGPEATPTSTPRPPAPTAAPRPPARPTVAPPNPSRGDNGKKDNGNKGKKNDR